MHVGARYYDAQVGRFVSRDTYLDQHPYLDCEHDGVNAVDPSGHYPTKRFWYWAGVSILVGVEVIAIGGGTRQPGLAAAAMLGTAMWAYGGDPGGPFWIKDPPPPQEGLPPLPASPGAGPPPSQRMRW